MVNYQLIFKLLLILLIEKSRSNDESNDESTDESNRYYCDTIEKVNEILGLYQNFFHPIINEDKIYFVFKNRIIYTKVPILKYDSYYRFNLFHFKLYEEVKTYNLYTNETKMRGHQIDLRTNLTDEIYSDYILYYFNQSDDYYNSTVLSKRVRFDKGNIGKFNETTKLFEDFYKFRPSFDFHTELVEMYENDKEFLMINLMKPHFDTTRLFFIFLINKAEFFKSAKDERRIRYCYGCNYYNVYGGLIHSFVFYPFKRTSEFESLVNNMALISIDYSYKIKYESLNFEPQWYYKLRTELKLLERKSMTFYFENLFSCPTEINDLEKDIKGISFNRENNGLFIFLRLFYLEFNEDLVENAFYDFEPNEIDYFNESKLFKFSHLKFKNNYEYEICENKYIKTIVNNSFLVFKPDVFELKFTNNSLKFMPIDGLKNKILNNINELCNKQTLVIELRYIYCLERDKYQFLFDSESDNNIINIEINNYNKYKYSTLIKNWKEDDKLMFTFNYKSNSVILMSLHFMYLFYLDDFKIIDKNTEDINIGLKRDPQVFKNCLFNPCLTQPPPIKISPNPYTESGEEKGLSHKLIEFLENLDEKDYIILAIILFLLIIAILSVYFIKTRRKSKLVFLNENQIQKPLKKLNCKSKPKLDILKSSIYSPQNSSFKSERLKSNFKSADLLINKISKTNSSTL